MYDAYYVEDFTKLTEQKRAEIASWQCDCMVTVAALGFGDIPPKAFIEALNIVKNEAWVAFNIKETFFDIEDDSGFSKMIRKLIFSKYLDVYYIERYRHRLSIDGEPLYYFAIAARKRFDVPDVAHAESGRQSGIASQKSGHDRPAVRDSARDDLPHRQTREKVQRSRAAQPGARDEGRRRKDSERRLLHSQ